MVSKCQFGTLAGVGGFLTLAGVVFLACWSALFDFVLNKQLVLSPTSYSFDLWADVPIPVYLEFNFFNWTNPDDILDPDPDVRRPKFVELGPYVFKEFRKKVVLGWHENNETVTFLQNRTWHFEPGLSRGSLDDVVTTLNVPAIAAAFVIRDYPTLVKGALNAAMILLQTNIRVDRKVREFTFEGYEDPLLDLAAFLPDGFLPVTIPFDKFGWFYTRNMSATYDGIFNMWTGKGNIQRFGQMAEWNYENPTSTYKSYCGWVNGSAGEFFLPKPNKESISLFSTDICRTLKMPFKEEVEVDGIKGYRYWGDEYIFDNLTRNPDNWCFSPSGENPPHGAIDVSTCKWNTPAFVSFPHFFNADPSYREAVEGMNPDPKVHQLYVDLDQRSGIPLQVEASMQINMLMQSYPEYEILRNLPKLYFPLFWFKERARIDDDIGSKIRLLNRVPGAGYVMFATMACIGAALLAIFAYYYIDFRRQRRSEADLKLVGT
ncbi:unnamed protein product [Orchesella dallaii]|uniref:Protein croquemort n=1 Tax=Orchesella dallaii TaxID=48710 RepID=A0ABP1QGJ2_9HEXA